MAISRTQIFYEVVWQLVTLAVEKKHFTANLLSTGVGILKID